MDVVAGEVRLMDVCLVAGACAGDGWMRRWRVFTPDVREPDVLGSEDSLAAERLRKTRAAFFL